MCVRDTGWMKVLWGFMSKCVHAGGDYLRMSVYLCLLSYMYSDTSLNCLHMSLTLRLLGKGWRFGRIFSHTAYGNYK